MKWPPLVRELEDLRTGGQERSGSVWLAASNSNEVDRTKSWDQIPEKGSKVDMGPFGLKILNFSNPYMVQMSITNLSQLGKTPNPCVTLLDGRGRENIRFYTYEGYGLVNLREFWRAGFGVAVNQVNLISYSGMTAYRCLKSQTPGPCPVTTVCFNSFNQPGRVPFLSHMLIMAFGPCAPPAFRSIFQVAPTFTLQGRLYSHPMSAIDTRS